MSIDRGMTALLIGGIGGLLLGATTEHMTLAEVLGHANLTPDCRAQIEEALRGGGAPE
jgi:hypothetical protein